MKTVGEARLWLKQKLKQLFSVEELPEIQLLILQSITGLTQTQQHIFTEKELSADQISMLLLSVKNLETGMPVQYALGEAWFFGLKFKVDSSVLIPRPETEELVAWVLDEKGERFGGERYGGKRFEGKRFEGKGLEGKGLMADSSRLTAHTSHLTPHTSNLPTILDIGTGSGCIPIAIKKNWPEAKVFGLDISAEALQTAQKNAVLNQVKVEFFQEDILNFYPVKEAYYSIIISNPPYIVPSEKNLMEPNVLNFEPHLALFVPETEPLLFYRAVADFASVNLKKNGSLFFEINPKFEYQLTVRLQEKGFTNIDAKTDFRSQVRMIKALKP